MNYYHLTYSKFDFYTSNLFEQYSPQEYEIKICIIIQKSKKKLNNYKLTAIKNVLF